MKRHLVVCDLDGTFLNSTGDVSAHTKEVVDALARAQWPLVLATARSLNQTLPLIEQLQNPPSVVCGNGSITYDAGNQTIISQRSISNADVFSVINSTRGIFSGSRFGLEGAFNFILEDSFELDEAISAGCVRVRDILASSVDFDIGKIIVQLQGDARLYYPDLHDKLSADVEVTASCESFCEVTAKGTSKATAVKDVADSMGFSSENVLAFGDMPNDASMLAWAGTGVAMGNAHPDVLKVAAETTLSNDDDGVAHFLNKLLTRRD